MHSSKSQSLSFFRVATQKDIKKKNKIGVIQTDIEFDSIDNLLNFRFGLKKFCQF